MRTRLLHCFFAVVLLAASPTRAERTIHVFGVFCNAYEGVGGAINEGVSADRVMIDNIFKSYFSEQSWGVKLRKEFVEGDFATRDGILSRFSAFAAAVGPEDTIYVHFSGHGVILDPAAGEQFLQAIDEEVFSRNDWAEAIEALPAKLKILITDCCSSYPEEFVVAEGDERVEPWKNLYSLLLEHEGFVNITAASPGQAAYGTEVGGFLTINLESDMQRFSSWEKVFGAASSRVTIETEYQLRAIGDTTSPAQEPFAYSLGTFTGGENTPAFVEYVIPDSDSRRLTYDELETMGLKQLYLARNEIFARHGYDFSSPFLQDYFGSLSWYRAVPGLKSPPVSALESENAELIRQVELDLGGPFLGGKKAMPGQGDGAAPDIFPWSSEQSLSRSVLQEMTPAELSIARNEIYARHGFSFSSPTLRQHFSAKPYYSDSGSSSEPNFNAVESHNVWLIRKIERLKGGAYSW